MIKFIVLVSVACFSFIGVAGQQLYPPVLDLTTLNGTNGFVIPGIDHESQFGAETRFIGDINNDGLEDIGIGVNNADINGLALAGAAYIIFGRSTGFPASFDITTLNGTNGFVVEGLLGSERMGGSVEGVGDINGDNIDDLIITSQGDPMVIYGKTTPFNAVLNIGYADGTNGFLIELNLGNQVAALGDVNGDGIDDFMISAVAGGQAWIVFGQAVNFPPTINISWIDGIKGFRTLNYSNSMRPSFLAGGAGDINNDGFNDILLGDWSQTTAHFIERTHLIYGRSTFQPQIDLETMPITEGFTISHEGGNFLAFVGTLGDINNDGIDDFFSEQSAIYGSATPFPAHIPLSSVADGTYGFILPGGLTTASIGDINQDGINDFISVYGHSGTGLEDAYVIFGSTTGFPNPIDETTLNGINGFIMSNFRTSNIGRPISGAGDINGDGISDFIVGSPNAIPQGSTDRTGEAFVIFGGGPLCHSSNRRIPTSN